MPDPAQQLARIYRAGFEIEKFERFPRALGVVRNECIALVEPIEAGLRIVGLPGWRIGGLIGVLTSAGGQQVFQAKGQTLPATPERLEKLRAFERDLLEMLNAQ
jgi:hypothetical protein